MCWYIIVLSANFVAVAEQAMVLESTDDDNNINVLFIVLFVVSVVINIVLIIVIIYLVRKYANKCGRYSLTEW